MLLLLAQDDICQPGHHCTEACLMLGTPFVENLEQPSPLWQGLLLQTAA